ncbi:MAG TPA: carbon starvation protein A [Planctomycetaceae bacterium]|nr:carbon starvation protein A [Planctomycetaceae bacterium]
MGTLLVAVGSFFGFILAYHTYGRWLARKVFALDPEAPVPAEALCDDVDYVPTCRSVVFGHHFTSIAGTGPIVGPAIAVFWGWLPALLWVVFGSILIGAVHDFGTLVVSMRNRGQTVGEIAGRVISKRARLLFLTILFLALTVVLAIFGLVIATIFSLYPGSVLAVWMSLPLAIGIGILSRRRGTDLLWPSIGALVILYVSVWVGVYWLPIRMPSLAEPFNATVIWTLILLVYCFFASVLPVWLLLQPRDYVNSHQLLVALGLLVVGLGVAGVTGKADLASAPAVAQQVPADAPPLIPFLFITVACGAVSGFHCLVSSGTSSKQLRTETDAQSVGYGAMLLEGALAVVVILACCAGVGMGKFERIDPAALAAAGATVPEDGPNHPYWRPVVDAETNQPLVGRAAWERQYSTLWADFRLPKMIGAFIEGGANFLTTLGIPLELAVGIVAVLVACFAATTLDSATRLQRYVIQELAGSIGLRPLTDKYLATGLAIGLGGLMAMIPAAEKAPAGTGGQILWPLFGAINQLLAGLALMVVVFHLVRRGRPMLFAAIPMVLMLIVPGWALSVDLLRPETGYLASGRYLLASVAIAVLLLQVWMIVEGLLVWRRARGVIEEGYLPLPPRPAVRAIDAAPVSPGP